MTLLALHVPTSAAEVPRRQAEAPKRLFLFPPARSRAAGSRTSNVRGGSGWAVVAAACRLAFTCHRAQIPIPSWLRLAPAVARLTLRHRWTPHAIRQTRTTPLHARR